ncbi:hypothetical protein MtrunA17_Chr7g0263571 [Medicago truncatula]|uniref:Transmembrane protein, putative n=1 Tax=Medicago truncatula TaxID=3880 RepID=G7L1P5_MEDTR|nr:uncharacterized protein LOC11441964 [Medicago truncatula]AES81786.1 transmembrane protein, putative [Medicago truncatula]RHN48419.1 hypothetical protein MtrunA17_Chr7g0263571 [Medicago truncatula]
MDIHTHISIPTTFISHRFSSPTQTLSSSSFHSYFPFKFVVCSKRDDQSQTNADNNGDKSSTDWDKAWSNFKKQGKKTLFSNFSPNKYVSWNPRRSDFPLSEEVDPIKRTERSNLKFWTSPTFTLGGALIILIVLLLYTLQAPINK